MQSRMTRKERREAWEAVAYLSPWIVGFLVFTAGPIVFSLGLSFFRWDVITPAEFVGLANYQYLAQDPLIRKSLWNTLFYVALYLPLSISVALGLAMLLNQKVRGMSFFRTIFYIPTLTQGVATFTLWSVIYEPETGIINRVLRNFVQNPPQWLVDPEWAKPALVIMALWAVGGTMLIFLAGLQGIPASLYEASELDGAGPWGKFRNVTLPLLSPTIFFNVVMTTIGSFQVFAAAFVLTGGGPSNATLFYVYYLFNRAFVYFNFGYASAMAWLLFLIILALTVFQIRMAPRWVHYG
jgi:multiple sugar transport system permease protein